MLCIRALIGEFCTSLYDPVEAPVASERYEDVEF